VGAHRCVGRRGEHVEDPAAQRELAVLIDQRLARVAELDQPACDRHRVGSLARDQAHGRLDQVAPGDGLTRDGSPRRDDHSRLLPDTRQRDERLEPPADRLVERGWPVEERHGDLREHVSRRQAREPQPQLVCETLGRGHEDEHGSPARGECARDRPGDHWPRRTRQPGHAELGTGALDPPLQVRLGGDRRLPQPGHGNSSQPSAFGRLKRSIARSTPASSASSSASATPLMTLGSRSASALVNRPRT